MGTRVSFWIDRAADHRARAAIDSGETFMRDFDRRLSRFNPTSELCALNGNPAETVEISSLMVRFLEAAIDAARISSGLCDPTLVDEIEGAGYRESRAGLEPASLTEALADAPPFVPAAPSPDALWRRVTLDPDARTVTRPVGVRFDSGGCGKGLAADMLAGLWRRLLPEHTAFVVDCGGDMRLGELAASDMPYEIDVKARPATPEQIVLKLRGGGVATSGIGNRVWLGAGGYAHHLLDPSTGRPAWTGVASATALGPTALMAETAAKAALLSGPDAGRIVLAAHGGVLVECDGVTTHLSPEKTEIFA
jgi:thiamine biosynthesis lipoprotein